MKYEYEALLHYCPAALESLSVLPPADAAASVAPLPAPSLALACLAEPAAYLQTYFGHVNISSGTCMCHPALHKWVLPYIPRPWCCTVHTWHNPHTRGPCHSRSTSCRFSPAAVCLSFPPSVYLPSVYPPSVCLPSVFISSVCPPSVSVCVADLCLAAHLQ